MTKSVVPVTADHLLAIGHNDMRKMHVGRMIGDKERVARLIMGDQGLRARHDAAESIVIFPLCIGTLAQ